MSYRSLKSRDTVHIAHCRPSFSVIFFCEVVVRDEPAPEHVRQQWSCTACTCMAMCVIILTLTLSQIFIRFAWLISPKSLIHWAAWIELLSDLHQEIWEPPQTCSMYDEFVFKHMFHFIHKGFIMGTYSQYLQTLLLKCLVQPLMITCLIMDAVFFNMSNLSWCLSNM